MDVRIAMLVGLTTAMVAIAIGAAEFAQAPPAPQPKAAPNGPSADGVAEPKADAPATEAHPSAVEPQQPQLIYSSWTKVCTKGQEPNARQVCFISNVGRVESGMPAVAAVLVEPEGEAKMALRVTLPLGMQLPRGTRLIVDQGQPLTAPYILCLADGCVADYEASQELIADMKKGHRLAVQGINVQGQAITLPLPLNDFAKAYDGPPTDPKVFVEQQKKLQAELQKRVAEAPTKSEGPQPSPR